MRKKIMVGLAVAAAVGGSVAPDVTPPCPGDPTGNYIAEIRLVCTS
jgi:hypothetical protein